MKSIFKITTAAFIMAGAYAMPVYAQKNLNVVMHSDLKILDPVFTTAFITRNHSYMVYDTLFAQDFKGDTHPQMVEKHTVSADGLLYTFTLRDGLKFHDGADVTTDDVIPSIKRWAVKSVVGQRMATNVEAYAAVDAKTFTIKLKEPSTFLIFALGNPSPPFVMPKRIAETDPNKQFEEYVGSGPFVFAKDEWKPGEKAVYKKFAAYVPRKDAPNGLAGAKIVNFDTVTWKVMADQQQAINALKQGDVDVIEQPAADLLPLVKEDKGSKIFTFYPPGFQYSFRYNQLHKPFDNPKIRQVLLYAFNQEDFLAGSFGDKELYKTCKALFGCGMPYESMAGMDGILDGNINKAKALLKEAGYDGTPIVLLHSTDLKVLTNLAPTAKQALEKVGFVVEMQSMDWQTLGGRRVKKEPPSQGGWSAMMTAWGASDIYSPLTMAFMNASCDKALFGWPCDAEMEKLRDEFAKETDMKKQKAIVDKIQLRWREHPTHIHLGQWVQPSAMRANITGAQQAPLLTLWGLDKK